MKSLTWMALGLVCLRAGADGVTEDMAAAAHRFLDALTPEQRAVAAFEWTDEERLNWHFIPKDRKGLTFKALAPAQRPLAHALLASGLSQRGYLKATTIMSLEQILQDMEGPNRRFPRDPELYHVSIFGTPSSGGTWGWRVEGHHLSVNFTVSGGRVASATPSFLGTNPAEVREGARKGLKTLAAEEALARKLLGSLTPEQKRKTVIEAKAPDDIITAASRKASFESFAGLPVSAMTPEQAATLMELVHEYVGRVRGEVASADLARIDAAGRDRIHFAWAGPEAEGQGHYYRIHGPTFVLEYDNTQNGANHVHAVWRDFENDFGLDLLREHYRTGHGK